MFSFHSLFRISLLLHTYKYLLKNTDRHTHPLHISSQDMHSWDKGQQNNGKNWKALGESDLSNWTGLCFGDCLQCQDSLSANLIQLLLLRFFISHTRLYLDASSSVSSLLTLMLSFHLLLGIISNKKFCHLCISLFNSLPDSEYTGSITKVGKGKFKDTDTTATTDVPRISLWESAWNPHWF